MPSKWAFNFFRFWSKHRWDFSHWMKRFRFKMKSQFLPFSLLSGKIYNTAVSEKSEKSITVCENCDAAVFANNYCIQIIEKKVRWAVLGLSHRIGFALIFMKISFTNLNSLKRDLSKNAIVSPPLFLLVNTF